MDPALSTYPCPAKVNLALSVGGPYGDALHPICSWMVRVSLFDDLIIARMDEGAEPEFDIDWAADAPQPSAIDWLPEEDLIFKAHQLIQQYAERSLPVAAMLRKRIPVGAGLGGGSSDAAMMLCAINEMFGLRLPHEALSELATHLGSDAMFFLGEPSAIVSGSGERIEPVPLEEPLHLALILPDLHCDTAEVYRRFDELSEGKNVDEAAVRALLATGATGEVPLFNDLAEPACRIQPKLAEIRRRCEEVVGRAVHVTGSGAGLFTVARDAVEARRLADAITTATAVPAMAVRTTEPDQ